MSRLTAPKKMNYRLAVISGVVVATAAYFGLFSVQSSYITRSGCLKAGGQLLGKNCALKGIELEVRG